MLSYPILYLTILYYTILGIKAHAIPVGSQFCKVKSNGFITKGRTTPCNQRITYMIDVFKINSKFLKYTIGKVVSRDGYRPLPTSMMK